MKYSIIIPCYNEGDNLPNLVSKILGIQTKYDVEYILVENGSTDSSQSYFKEFIENKFTNIVVVYVENNLGYGFGIQQGLKVAMGDYVGWIHADMQVPLEVLERFFDSVEKNSEKKLFLKGRRCNRLMFDRFFTGGQSIFNSLLFGMHLYDVGAIPVLFHKELIERIRIDDLPNDFSIELGIYVEAIRNKFVIQRQNVFLCRREKGNSSWNKGFFSKFRQSKVIFLDSFKIWKGTKVL